MFVLSASTRDRRLLPTAGYCLSICFILRTHGGPNPTSPRRHQNAKLTNHSPVASPVSIPQQTPQASPMMTEPAMGWAQSHAARA